MSVTQVIGPQEVEVLCSPSPGQLAVRLTSQTLHFRKLQQRLAREGPLLSLLGRRRVVDGRGCLVKEEGRWCRGRLRLVEEGEVEVRLVDLGKTAKVLVKELKEIPESLLEECAYSFLCHLPGCEMVESQNILRKLDGKKVVMLHRRGPPEKKNGLLSLPVEISWKKEEFHDPVGPPMQRFTFLTQQLLAPESAEDSGILSLEDSFSLSSISIEDAIPHSPLRSQEVGPTFRWPDPVLPASKKFHAKVTFVDAAGQIYLQLCGLQHQYSELRNRMKQVLEGSTTDCALDSFRARQEVMARWEDGHWYRARFLSYAPYAENKESFVFFVDFGNTSKVDTADLRSHLVSVEQAIFTFRAVLHDLVPVGRSWSPTTLDFMSDELLNLQAVVVRVRGHLNIQPLLVDLRLPPSSEGEPWVLLSDLLLLQGGVRKPVKGEVEGRERRADWAQRDQGVRFTLPEIWPPTPDLQSQLVPDDEGKRLLLASGLQPGEVLSCRLLRLRTWDTAIVRLEGGEAARPGLETLAQFSCMTEELGMVCPNMPPLLGGCQEAGPLVALARKGGWARARLLGGGKVALLDWDKVEEVLDSRLLKELPAKWESLPCQALVLKLVLDAEDDGRRKILELCRGLEGCLLRLRVVTVGEAGLRGHLLHPDTGHTVYTELQVQGGLRVGWK